MGVRFLGKLTPATEKLTDDMARVLASGFGALVEVLKALGPSGVEH